MKNTINEIIKFLKTEYSDDGYYVQEFADNIYFGIDKNNKIICLKRIFEPVEKIKFRTDCLELLQNYDATLILDDKNIIGNFNIIICNSKDNNDIETIVRLCYFYLLNEKNNDMISLMKTLVELFQITSNKDEKYEVGLWGELFIIYYLNNKFNFNVSPFWHTDFFLKYDFSLDNIRKIEVKTTSKSIRIHRVKHEQIYTTNNVLLVSVLVRKDDTGLSVYDLFDKIKESFCDDYNISVKYERMLRKIDRENAERYDLTYSFNNVKFYKNKSIPKFESNEPDGVCHTEYDIDLTNVDCLIENDLHDFLFKVND